MKTNDDWREGFCRSLCCLLERMENLNVNEEKWEEGKGLFAVPGFSRLGVVCLLLSAAACGAPVSEKAPGPVPNASKGVTAGGGAVTGTALRGSDQDNRNAGSSAEPATETDERDNRSIPGVPDAVVKELGSADARDRYRALDHWEKKDSKASLDPVFEAMEDEDAGVREKATVIIEKRWAQEKEKEHG